MNKNNLTINAIRMLGIQAINKANSGHPGIVLGAAPMIYTLFRDFLYNNPKDPSWLTRDRFLLSAGHGSALLYSTLHIAGFDIKIEDIKEFRQINSKTPGHPENILSDCIEATTGPLGQGIANGVGFAMAEKYLSDTYNKEDIRLFNNYTYVLCGDGDLQEGVALEAISLAGVQKLNKLIVLFDSNDIQLDNPTKYAQKVNFKKMFKANQWNYILVKDGKDTDEIHHAISLAHQSDKPTLIEVKTVIGYGSTNEGTCKVHGAALGADIENVKKFYNWEYEDFFVPKEAYEDFQNTLQKRSESKEAKWNRKFLRYQEKYPKLYKEIIKGIKKEFDFDITEMLNIKPNYDHATRVSSGLIFNELQKRNLNIIGGSADLSSSTNIKGINGNFGEDKHGRNINYGVREFAMTAINNGIAAYGLILPFAGGFFAFADYCKAALRLASLSELQSINVFTHDSIFLGEDGPTHQPVEQIASLRAQPNINVYRPADFIETLGCYNSMLKYKRSPSALILSRQNLPQIENSSPYNVKKGAYIIYESEHELEVVITATGSEVHLAIQVAKLFNDRNIGCRVISMVCRDIFEQQPHSYYDKLYKKIKNRVTIEASSTFGWSKYGDLNIGIDHFGFSGKINDIQNAVGFDIDSIYNKIESYLIKNKTI